MGAKHIIKGLLTFVPGLSKFATHRTGGTNSARYCYSVWLRHLILAQQCGLFKWPKVIAELGPGDSLGIGLAAVLSGAERYYALDVVEYANVETNLKVLDELISLFIKRAPIPDQHEFPMVRPLLETYEFPRQLLTEDRIERNLRPQRIQCVRDALRKSKDKDTEGIEISYICPWHDSSVIRLESVDMILSQAVLEHVNDLPQAYEALYCWLKADGLMSHQIDFGCHGTANVWNGHWAYSDYTWRLIKGKRAYLLNREPYSTHRRLLHSAGFRIVCQIKCRDSSGIARARLSSRFRSMPEEDLTTRTIHVLATKA